MLGHECRRPLPVEVATVSGGGNMISPEAAPIPSRSWATPALSGSGKMGFWEENSNVEEKSHEASENDTALMRTSIWFRQSSAGGLVLMGMSWKMKTTGTPTWIS